MKGLIVASAGGTTLPGLPVKSAEANFPAWPIIGVVILVVVIGLILARKR